MRFAFVSYLFMFIMQIILLYVQYGETALSIAVSRDDLVTAKMLMEKGASVHVKDEVC